MLDVEYVAPTEVWCGNFLNRAVLPEKVIEVLGQEGNN